MKQTHLTRYEATKKWNFVVFRVGSRDMSHRDKAGLRLITSCLLFASCSFDARERALVCADGGGGLE